MRLVTALNTGSRNSQVNSTHPEVVARFCPKQDFKMNYGSLSSDKTFEELPRKPKEFDQFSFLMEVLYIPSSDQFLFGPPSHSNFTAFKFIIYNKFIINLLPFFVIYSETVLVHIRVRQKKKYAQNKWAALWQHIL